MSVNESNEYEAGKLDSIRLQKGPEEVRTYFGNIAAVDKNVAVALINDETLQFPTLYLVKSTLVKTGLLKRINNRYLNALKLTNAIIRKDKKCIDYLVESRGAEVHEALKWILLTGCTEDGLENKYEELMELAAALIVRYYNDTSILPAVADMIFKRYRKGMLVHNIIWVFFEAKDPESLLLLANYLDSQESKDYELASRLLAFIPSEENTRSTAPAKKYHDVSQWIRENNRFLYRTEECLHLSANPIPYVLSQEAKYLCKPVSSDNGIPFRDYSEDQENLLSGFRALDANTCMQLADYSYLLYRHNIDQWNQWISFPIENQVRSMNMAVGGRI